MVEVKQIESSASGFGISETPVGIHLSRTLMLDDLRRLLEQLPPDTDAERYRQAIIQENVLLKPTTMTRQISFQRLCGLYALNPTVPLFQILRELWTEEHEAQPLLALLCALARDMVLRSTAEQIIALPLGEAMTPAQLSATVRSAFPGRYSEASMAGAGRNLASSWQQSGHLTGKMRKVRATANCRPPAVVLALLLGYVQGERGEGLFRTLWARVLDAPAHTLHAQAQAASQRGWLEYRRAGDVVEIGFRHLMRAVPQDMP